MAMRCKVHGDSHQHRVTAKRYDMQKAASGGDKFVVYFDKYECDCGNTYDKQSGDLIKVEEWPV